MWSARSCDPRSCDPPGHLVSLDQEMEYRSLLATFTTCGIPFSLPSRRLSIDRPNSRYASLVIWYNDSLAIFVENCIQMHRILLSSSRTRHYLKRLKVIEKFDKDVALLFSSVSLPRAVLKARLE